MDSGLSDAAVDKQLGSVDEAAVVRGEEYRRFGNLFHPANTAEWNEAAKVPHEPFTVLRRHQSLESGCADGSGTEHIDPEPAGLQRTTRRVTVTPEGAAYYERAGDLISQLQDMDAQVAKARAQHKGRLRVDIGSSSANMILIPALAEFAALYPDIQLEIGVSERAVDLIGDGVDCVIRGVALADTSLVGRCLDFAAR